MLFSLCGLLEPQNMLFLLITIKSDLLAGIEWTVFVSHTSREVYAFHFVV